MKYASSLYAKALVAAIKESPKEASTISRRIIEVAERNGDLRSLPKIIREAEKIILKEKGHREIRFETARPMTREMRHPLLSLLKSTDKVEEKVSPELVAGVRVVINDELLWDGTLKAKIEKLFQN